MRNIKSSDPEDAEAWMEAALFSASHACYDFGGFLEYYFFLK